MTKLKNSNGDKTEKSNFDQTQIVTKLKNLNFETDEMFSGQLFAIFAMFFSLGGAKHRE